MVTEQDLEDLNIDQHLWPELIHIQCMKPPDVVGRTFELLEKGGQMLQANHLRGQ